MKTLGLTKRCVVKLLFSLLVLVSPVFSNAQELNIQYKKGYRPDVELSWANNGQFSINTTQAYSFGNGMSAGLGVGFAADFLGNDFNNEYVEEPTYLIPLFLNFNYSFLDNNVSPMVGARIGEMFDVTNSGLIVTASPYVGIDFSRFTFAVGYEFQKAVAELSNYCPADYLDKGCLNKIRLSFGFTF
ncbi:MAG: hypothetical protein IKU01_08270 [Bacteroidales bacterium]|nr:hypothetical protein [Bacteroidales bacterium]